MERLPVSHNKRVIITAILACLAVLLGTLLRYSPVYAPASPASEEAVRDFYGFIRDMRQGEGTVMVIVDEFQFLSGEEAIAQAMRDTGCPRDKVADCIPSLNNDFYIRAKDPNSYSYRIAPDASVIVLKNGTSPLEEAMTTDQFASHYASLQNILRSMPFALTAHGSTLVKVEQKYIP